MTSEQVAKVLSSLGKRKVCFQHGDKVEIVKGINVTNDNVILISELLSSTNSQNMKHIKFTIDITLSPDKEFLTKEDFVEAVYTCYGNIRDVAPDTIIKID